MWLIKSLVISIILGVGFYYLKSYWKDKKCLLTDRIENKVVLITGANSGIGFELAKELARRGGIIHLACRNTSKCKQAKELIIKETMVDNNKVYDHHLDLSNLKSILTFSKTFVNQTKKLHILVNNAAVMMTPYSQTKDGFELQIGTNHLGHFLLTNELIRLMKSNEGNRIINVASIGHLFGSINTSNINLEVHDYSPSKAYTQSKLANMLHAKELAKRLSKFNITVVSVHPGAVDTELQREWPKWIRITYKLFTLILIKSPVEGIQTPLCCCVDPNLMKFNGKYFAEVEPAETFNSEFYNDTLAEWLWNHSENLIEEKLKFIKNI